MLLEQNQSISVQFTELRSSDSTPGGIASLTIMSGQADTEKTQQGHFPEPVSEDSQLLPLAGKKMHPNVYIQTQAMLTSRKEVTDGGEVHDCASRPECFPLRCFPGHNSENRDSQVNGLDSSSCASNCSH